MKYDFKNKKVLVVNSGSVSRKLLVGVLRVLVVGTIKDAEEANQAFRIFNEQGFDVVIAEINNGSDDVIPLTRKIRNCSDPKKANTPIIALCGPRSMPFLEMAEEVGVNEIIRAPYSTDVVSETLNYVFNMSEQGGYADALESGAEVKSIEQKEDTKQEEWADHEDAFSITHMLLDHYIKHNEIVLAKLRFAQDATKKSIMEFRNTYEKVKSQDKANIGNFDEFDRMWEEIIKLFIKGGLSEDDIFKIESLITTIPSDIKAHYNDLSQQDVNFMNMLEGLNTSAYKKAKTKVMALHRTPNPFNGKTIDDYAVEKEGGDVDVLDHLSLNATRVKIERPNAGGPRLVDPRTKKNID